MAVTQKKGRARSTGREEVPVGSRMAAEGVAGAAGMPTTKSARAEAAEQVPTTRESAGATQTRLPYVASLKSPLTALPGKPSLGAMFELLRVDQSSRRLGRAGVARSPRHVQPHHTMWSQCLVLQFVWHLGCRRESSLVPPCPQQCVITARRG